MEREQSYNSALCSTILVETLAKKKHNANKDIRVVWSSDRGKDEREWGDRKKSEEGNKGDGDMNNE